MMTVGPIEGLARMNGSRPTLMVVDDEPHVLVSLNDLFRKEYRVETFENAPQALIDLLGGANLGKMLVHIGS